MCHPYTLPTLPAPSVDPWAERLARNYGIRNAMAPEMDNTTHPVDAPPSTPRPPRRLPRHLRDLHQVSAAPLGDPLHVVWRDGSISTGITAPTARDNWSVLGWIEEKEALYKKRLSHFIRMGTTTVLEKDLPT